jgi:hypothetical protein
MMVVGRLESFGGMYFIRLQDFLRNVEALLPYYTDYPWEDQKYINLNGLTASKPSEVSIFQFYVETTLKSVVA